MPTGGVQGDRWNPDMHLVAAVLAGSRTRMADLGAPDRCWVVAGLVAAGLTREEIADRLDCSLRLVAAIKADAMTTVCSLMQSETSVFADEARLLRSELRCAELERAAAVRDRDRAREQLARVLDARTGETGTGAAESGAVKVCRCGATMDRYNTYVHPASGKRYCRACRRDRQRRYEQRVSASRSR